MNNLQKTSKNDMKFQTSDDGDVELYFNSNTTIALSGIIIHTKWIQFDLNFSNKYANNKYIKKKRKLTIDRLMGIQVSDQIILP